MADVTIDVSVESTQENIAVRGGPFWVSPTVGYIFYCGAIVDKDLKYNKTVDGGATWGGTVNIRTGTIWSYDCWADWQTAGDAGTKIHIVYLDADSNDARYVYLDTSDDSVGGDDQIEAAQGNGSLNTGSSRINHFISITKTRGGNLAVALRYRDTVDAEFHEFYTSPDGANWTNKVSPWEAQANQILLFPGNEADNQDVWATFWDILAEIISLKTYDDSGNSWSKQQIAASMVPHTSLFLQMDGAIRLSDGHLIFAAWNLVDDADADLMTWDINGAGSITPKTNVLTNDAASVCVSVFVDQDSDDVYICYFSGTSVAVTIAAFYQKSDNGMGTWGGETAMQADAADDERWISAGAVKAAWGGKYQPIWYNDDFRDLFTNTDNGILIAAAVVEPPAGIPVQSFMHMQRMRRN